MVEALYIAFIALFLTHELDAVQRHEWRMLPLLQNLPESTAARVFIWGHIPLDFLILWEFTTGAQASILRNMLAGFGVAHVGLHWWFQRHPANEFNTLGSKALIWLTGLCGGAYLGLQL